MVAMSTFTLTLALELKAVSIYDSFNWATLFPVDYVPPKRRDATTIRLLTRSRFAYNTFDALMIG